MKIFKIKKNAPTLSTSFFFILPINYGYSSKNFILSSKVCLYLYHICYICIIIKY